MKTLSLFDGNTIPAIGLGTWQSESAQVASAVAHALKIGYRHIDCAAIYLNETSVGDGIQTALEKKSITREQLWVTSKLWNSFHSPDDVVPALKESLHALKLDHLDLYLMHWPIAFAKCVGLSMPEGNDAKGYLTLKQAPLIDTWHAMEEAVKDGLVRYIGVSNFSQTKLDTLLDAANIQPAVNQVECHPYLAQSDLIRYCRNKNMIITAYAPLGSPALPSRIENDNEPALLSHETIAAIAQAHKATTAQIMLAWQLQRGVTVIPKSTNESRIAENLAALDITLNEKDMREMKSLNNNQRFFSGEFFAGSASPYTASNIFDEY